MTRGCSLSPLILAFLFIHTTACSPYVNRTPDRNGAVGSTADVIDSSELAATKAATLYEALRQLRPEFFRGNPDPASNSSFVMPRVYVDEQFVGDLSALNTVPLTAVREARFLRPSQARDRYGAYCHCEGGIIVLRLRSVRG